MEVWGMIGFIGAGLVGLAWSFILPPLLESKDAAQPDDAGDANLLVYRDQLRELQAEVKNGLLSEAQYEQDKEELERRLLEEVGEAKPSRRVGKYVTTRKLGYAIGISIPIVAILFYILVGQPKALDPRALTPPNMQTR